MIMRRHTGRRRHPELAVGQLAEDRGGEPLVHVHVVENRASPVISELESDEAVARAPWCGAEQMERGTD